MVLKEALTEGDGDISVMLECSEQKQQGSPTEEEEEELQLKGHREALHMEEPNASQKLTQVA